MLSLLAHTQVAICAGDAMSRGPRY